MSQQSYLRKAPNTVSILHAIILGIIQGLSEFLPISSSGHLILARDLFGWNFATPTIEKTFDVALHMGTFLGIAIYFWKDIGRLFTGFVSYLHTRDLAAHPYSKLSLLVLISTIPAAVVGLKFDDLIERNLGQPLIICGLLIGFGILLAWADIVGRRERVMENLHWKDAAIVGVAQAIALAPGTSRSGVTMTAGLFLGLDRESAARYSFLISLPAIAGAALYKGAKLAMTGIPDGLGTPMIAGTLAAAISGLIAIAWLLRYVQTHNLKPFVLYRIAVGVILAIIFVAR
jgi:undecaprenyl-diphosphatase